MSKLRNVLFFVIFVLNYLQLSTKSVSSDEKCRILALEGGGDRGAYQAGVIRGFVESLPLSEIGWDVVSGISAGTLNAIGMALFPKGQEKEASDFINKVWLEIKGRNDILRSKINIPLIGNIIGPVWGAFYGDSVFDSTPLKELLTRLTKDKTLQRLYNFGATSIRTGKYIRFQNVTKEFLVEAALSSSAVPGIFPPINYGNDTFVDGGLSYFFDLTSAIKICVDQGFKDTKIIIDLVLCFEGDIDPIIGELNTFDILMQSFTILSSNYKNRDLLAAKELYPGVTIRYMVSPSEKISKVIPLDFDPKEIRKSIDLGVKDSKNQIKLGEGYSFNEEMKKYREELKKQLKVLEDI